ncbi:MAG TPA: AMP-binding protein, partial [Acidimicrobiales bacterium]|nr:AMP-binding protein [Acidimicrobiales bacterium]
MRMDEAGRSAGPGALIDPVLAKQYRVEGWWGDRSLADVVSANAVARPDAEAVVSRRHRMTWRAYDEISARVATALVRAGYARGDRLAVWMPDSPIVHATYLGAERAGITVVGIGSRAGNRELRHVIEQTGARGLATWPSNDRDDPLEVVAGLRAAGTTIDHIVVPSSDDEPDAPILIEGQTADVTPVDLTGLGLGPDDLFLVNSTSGTTGLPKCVMHHQNRWMYFHQKAVENAELVEDDVFLAAVPAPYGFGIWTSHFTPALLGAKVVVVERFEPGDAIDLLEQERVTVLGCVSTQFIMMLEHPAFASADLSSLRVMFTGGEAIPYERAAAFEDQTGCTVLQFFGSNETGL